MAKATATPENIKPLTAKEKKDLAILGGVAALLAIYTSTKPTVTTPSPTPTPVSTTPTGAGGAGTQPGITPGVPVSLTQTGATTSSITLTWTAVQNAINYLVYDYTTNLLVGQSSTNTITVNGLQANTHYTWYVEAQSATGQTSGASAPATVSTTSSTQVATTPSVPQALVVTSSTPTSVSFSWATVTGATYYQITTLPAGQSTGGQVLSPITGTTATVSGLSPNVNYQFSLQACNTAGCSNPSGLTFAITPSSTSLVQGITVSPQTATVNAGQTQQFTATATYANGTTSDISNTATWTTGSQTTATINSSGLLTGVNVGSTTISACIGNVCNYAVIVVEPATSSTQGQQSPNNISAGLARISVSPSTLSLASGQTQQMTATGTYSDGHSQDVTGQVTWSNNNTGVATISSSGLLSSRTSGIVTISACISGICGSSMVTVPLTASQQAAAQQQALQISQQQALQLAQQRATAFASSEQAQLIAQQQATSHNSYASSNNYGTPVSTTTTPQINTVPGSPGATLTTQSTYYNPTTGTYNYLTTNNGGGYTSGQYVPVTTGLTNVKPGQSTTLMENQCQTGTLNGKSGSWDGYGNFHPGCTDCKCPVHA